MKDLVPFGAALIIALAAGQLLQLNEEAKQRQEQIQETQEPDTLQLPPDSLFDASLWQNVVVTIYNPTAAQCDSTPLMTADCSRIDTTALKARKLRWCAVSRDLLDVYKFGDTLQLDLGDEHWATGPWIVHDTMAKRWSSRVDLLCWYERTGKWNGKLIK